ncbi:ABC transporter substrate-binding protein [Paucibacter soli]|uniref:ABC transporter substrate-binding protein n=1 Tax=Paucibacter soli TaxID=3133433 RepID=UPI0030AE4B0F
MPRRLLALLLLLCCSQQTAALSIAFINPGRSDEAFWVAASQAMQGAAQSLRLQLEVLYAEREPTRALQLAREIAARPALARPDYVILVNEKGTLVANAQTLGAAGIPSFAAFSGLLPQERSQWAPRQGLPLLLGSLEPGARDAGYMTAKALVMQGLRQGKRGGDGRVHLLAIAGDRSTPVSIQRNEGMRQAVAEFPMAALDEMVYADWKRPQAAELMRGLLQRHPQARLVWAGSDQMAFGAMEALEQDGREPGKQLLFSAINTSNEAMQAIISGRLTALAGGHFMSGAWAIVMLYDHYHGRDFADEGLELERPMFMLFDKPGAQRYLERFGAGIKGLDFRPYSKYLNPKLQRYPFSLDGLLR